MKDKMKYCRDCLDRMDCELYVNYLKYEACHHFRGVGDVDFKNYPNSRSEISGKVLV